MPMASLEAHAPERVGGGRERGFGFRDQRAICIGQFARRWHAAIEISVREGEDTIRKIAPVRDQFVVVAAARILST